MFLYYGCVLSENRIKFSVFRKKLKTTEILYKTRGQHGGH